MKTTRGKFKKNLKSKFLRVYINQGLKNSWSVVSVILLIVLLNLLLMKQINVSVIKNVDGVLKKDHEQIQIEFSLSDSSEVVKEIANNQQELGIWVKFNNQRCHTICQIESTIVQQGHRVFTVRPQLTDFYSDVKELEEEVSLQIKVGEESLVTRIFKERFNYNYD